MVANAGVKEKRCLQIAQQLRSRATTTNKNCNDKNKQGRGERVESGS